MVNYYYKHKCMVNNEKIYVISAFCREVGENCGLLSYYAASSGNSFYRRFGTKYRFIYFLILEDGTDRLSRNVGKNLPLLVA